MFNKIILLSLIVLSLSLFNFSFSQQKPVSQPEPVFSIPPSEGHRILADGKTRALAKAREAYRPEAFASQWEFDAIYYGLDLKIDVPTEIIYGAVTMQAKSKVSSLDIVALDLYDNMTVDSIKMGTTNLSYTHSTDLINITLNRAYTLDENFLLTVYYHGHPVEGGFQAFDFSYHGSPSVPIISS